MTNHNKEEEIKKAQEISRDFAEKLAKKNEAHRPIDGPQADEEVKESLEKLAPSSIHVSPADRKVIEETKKEILGEIDDVSTENQ